MVLYLDGNGNPYGGDRQYGPDGIFDPEIPDRPGEDYTWNKTMGAWQKNAPIGEWEQLAAQFNFPGNGLYGAIYNCVKAASSDDLRDHWSNFKLLIVTPALQSNEALAAGINYLVYLLALGNQAIPADAKIQWNSLVSSCKFPDTCKLQ